MSGVLSGPGAEPPETDHFRSIHKKDGAHYNIYGFKPGSGIAALKQIFPDGKANGLNFVLFSTSGVHGSYTTLDEIETSLKKYGGDPEFDEDEGWPEDYHGNDLTVLIVHPRLVCLRYGNVEVTLADIPYLRGLQQSSFEAMAKIGTVP